MSEYTLYLENLENVFGINNTDYNLCTYVMHECILRSIFPNPIFLSHFKVHWKAIIIRSP